MIGISRSDPGVKPVEGDRFSELGVDREGDSIAMAPAGGPGAKFQSLLHPRMNRQAEPVEMVLTIEGIRAELVIGIELVKQANEELVEASPSGMVDRVTDPLMAMVLGDPVAQLNVALSLAALKFSEGALMGDLQECSHTFWAGVVEQVIGIEPKASGGHGQEVLIRAEGGIDLQSC